MHVRQRARTRWIIAIGAISGTVIGLGFVFHDHGLNGAASYVQILSGIVALVGLIKWAQGKESSSKGPRPPVSVDTGPEGLEDRAPGNKIRQPGGQLGRKKNWPRLHPLTRGVARGPGDWIVLFTIAACALMASIVVIVAHILSNGGMGGAHPPTGPSLPSGITVQRTLMLTASNYCEWRFGVHPMPLASTDPPKFRVDNRCTMPVSRYDPSDPSRDTTTNIHSGMTNSHENVIDKVSDGDELRVMCWGIGDNSPITLATQPVINEASNLWLGVRTPGGTYGYVADVFVGGGGYTKQQLLGLGITRCG